MKSSELIFQLGIFETVSLVIAMMFLIQFYKQTKVALKEHSPLLKFIAIKLVIFLFYLQTVSLLIMLYVPSDSLVHLCENQRRWWHHPAL